jgi:hypothetical protein
MPILGLREAVSSDIFLFSNLSWFNPEEALPVNNLETIKWANITLCQGLELHAFELTSK